MHCLIIYAHPKTKSYVVAILQSFIAGWISCNHTYEMIDLYHERFIPVLPLDELSAPDRLHSTSTAAHYQDKIRAADLIVFVFPTWWQGTPAILKGFMDRVFAAGFAYKMKGRRPEGLFKDKAALVINTYAAPGWMVKLNGDRAFKTLKYDFFSLCGIKKVFRFSTYRVWSVSDQTRLARIEKAKKFGATLSAKIIV